MKKSLIFTTTFLCLVCLLLSACQSGQVNLQGTSWQLVSYGSADQLTPAVTGVETSLTFGKDGQVNGNLGCNSFSGSYSIKEGKIVFGSLIATMMACPDAQMSQESAAFKALNSTVSYELGSGSLTITAADGTRLILTGK
jgi:Heat shock protein